MAVSHKLITLVVIATGPGLAWLTSCQGFKSYLTLYLVEPNQVRAAAKISAGVWGVPREFYSQLYTKSYLQTTAVKISSME